MGWYGRDGRDGLNRKGGIGRKGWEEMWEGRDGKGGMRREGGMEWIHDSKGGMEWEGRDEKRWEW